MPSVPNTGMFMQGARLDRGTLGGGSPALADLQLPLTVDAEVILEKPAEFLQPMLHE